MRASTRGFLGAVGLVLAALVLAGCAAGDARFTEASPAGFWNGLWHGIILVFAFVVSLFSDTVGIYEVNNTGGWYDFGFLLGALIVWGSSSGGGIKGINRRKRARDWEELGADIERAIMRKIEAWVAEEDGDHAESDLTEEEWRETRKKLEAKIKRLLRDLANEE